MTSIISEPYFLSNKEWYTFDLKQFKYVLTSKATEKAKESYETFYKQLNGSYFKEDEITK